MAEIFKVLGLLLIFCVCTAAGCLKAASVRRRAKMLGVLCECLRELKERLRYEGTERTRLIGSAFANSGIIELNSSGVFVAECGLSAQDKARLEDFLRKFGEADTITETDRVQLCLSLFTQKKESVEQQATEQAKLYRTVGICAGAVGCLILI